MCSLRSALHQPSSNQRKNMGIYEALITAVLIHRVLAVPSFYKHVNLNSFCDGHIDSSIDLGNASSSLSSAIVTATQRRHRRGNPFCECKVGNTGGTGGLIVTIEELNLRKGSINQSCIDFVITGTKYWNEDSPRCGVVTRKDLVNWVTTYSVTIELHTQTPISYFIDGYLLRMIITRYIDGYRCDGNNNCGDLSDESLFGNSMCSEYGGSIDCRGEVHVVMLLFATVMPRSSLILITMGLTIFSVTWLSVLMCCVRSVVLKRRVLMESRGWGTVTPPVATVLETSIHEKSEAQESMDAGTSGLQQFRGLRNRSMSMPRFRNPFSVPVPNQEQTEEIRS
ncbi:uncharacterized protein LOC135393005 isoform X2 [Ornithodoros turicata]|uniref:uncharacterized protein LOC135393005 isoform X2 n=1 Tax=Ornithodoros turicata TaxID=34597 RepID=UPI003138C4F8